jgi:hypothetical protein
MLLRGNGALSQKILQVSPGGTQPKLPTLLFRKTFWQFGSD